MKSAKRKAQTPKAAGRSFIPYRKSNGPISEPWGRLLRKDTVDLELRKAARLVVRDKVD